MSRTPERLVWVTYAYPIDGIGRKKRSAEQVFVRDLFPVSIRSIEAAPTALTITHRSEPAPTPFPIHKAFEGKLWRPVRGADGDAIDQESSLDSIFAGKVEATWDWQDYPFRHPMLPKALSPFRCRPADEAEFRTVISDRRGKAEAEVAKMAKEVLVIGGVLHRRAAEPVYVVAMTEPQRSVRIFARSEQQWPEGLSSAVFFRADELHQAEAFARTFNAAPIVESIIESHHPYDLNANTRHLTVRHCFWSLLSRGFGFEPGTEWLPIETFSVWAQFRDYASTYLGERQANEALSIRALKALSELHRRLPTEDDHPAAKFSNAVRSRSALVIRLLSSGLLFTNEADEAALGVGTIGPSK